MQYTGWNGNSTCRLTDFRRREREGSPTIISDNVTIGHNATIHACEIGNNALIGMGSVILDQSKIEEFAFIAFWRRSHYPRHY